MSSNVSYLVFGTKKAMMRRVQSGRMRPLSFTVGPFEFGSQIMLRPIQMEAQ